MKFTTNWLKQYVEISSTQEELSDKLTFGGVEVEAVHNNSLGELLKSIIIAKVVEAEKHPNADKLTLCKVDTGTEIVQIICGAPNCRAGMIGALAPIGAVLGDFKIGKVKLKGLESCGMLCSEKELQLSDNHQGIIELPNDAPIGMTLASYLEVDDSQYEVEVTPNRPDLLGIIGIARDLAALENKNLIVPRTFPNDGFSYPNEIVAHIPAEDRFTLENNSGDLCPRYLARFIDGVTVKESPLWMKAKLKSAGISPINNIVDITNYVMMELGHPLHAFDYSKLSGKKIIVRNATADEEIAALDHKSYDLSVNDIVIADSEKPIAIAGIIGAESSAIDHNTTSIVLEAANFNYAQVRKTAQRLRIHTESAYRFERNMSDETVALISQRATDIILELAGGNIIAVIDSYHNPAAHNEVTLRVARVNRILALNLDSDTIDSYLVRLGLIPKDKNSERIVYQIPAYRKDLTREIDLIEEIIRIHGFNKTKAVKRTKEDITDKTRLKIKRNINQYFVHNGFYEVVNSSFADEEQLKMIDTQSDYYELNNPLGSSSSILRTSLLPGVLQNCTLNINNGQDNLKLFELAKTFIKDGDSPKEEYFLSGIITGLNRDNHWKYKAEKADIFTLKGYIHTLIKEVLKLNASYIPAECSFMQQGTVLSIEKEGTVIGYLGKIDPMTAKKFDIDQPVFAFEINIEKIIAFSDEKVATYSGINRYPSVERDISFIISDEFTHRQIIETINNSGPELIKDVRLFDLYQGENVPDNHKSLTYKVIIGSEKGTLTDDVINDLLNSVINELKNKYQIEMR